MSARFLPKGIGVVLSVSVICVLSLFPVQGYAQAVGATLSGTVTDPSGAVIPNAQVSVTNTATGIASRATTDAAGFYTLPNLLPATYEATVTAAGFSTERQTNIVLGVGAQQQLNFSMKVGETTQTVSVTEAAPTVELTSSTLSGQVESTTVRELPLNGRDWASLATLEPGVVPVRTQVSATSPTAPRSGRGFGNALSDAGHRPNENNYRINGISVLDYANTAPGSVLGGALGVDAIQQFSVLTSNYSAEYGHTTGGVINAITKSGTNAFHGNAYWFLRDEGLDARNFFDKTLPPFHRNDFGGSIGGPIIKDKTFFFFDYEGIRSAQGISLHDFVPSPAARAGNLCSIPIASGKGACSPTTVAVNPLVAPVLVLYPLPDSGLVGNGDTGIFNTAANAQFSENYESARGDHRFSDKDSLAVSWFRDYGPFSQPDALVETLNANSIFRTMASIEETHVFSPTLVNTARFGYNRAVGMANTPVQALVPAAADHSLASIPGQYAAILQVPGLTTMAGAFGDASRSRSVFNTFQAYDDAFLTRGTHAIKFGFAFEREQFNGITLGKANGTFTFPSLQSFLLGNPTQAIQFPLGAHLEAGLRQSIYAGYVQDDWRARSNLTLNFGLRYEPTTLPREANNLLQSMQSIFTGISVPVATLWHTNMTLKDLEPRVGFAWDPFHNGKTAVRGGIGIFDNLPLPWLYGGGSSFGSLPFGDTLTQGGLAPGSYPRGIDLNIVGNPAKETNRYVEQNPPLPYGINWNVNIQRQITSSLTLMVGEVGSHSIHQPNTPDQSNMVLPTLTSAGYLWPFPVGSGTLFNPSVGTIRALTWAGSASYEALQTQVTKRMSHGLQAQGAFTYGKCIDDGSGGTYGDLFGNSPASLLWFDEGSRRGLCDFNIGKNFVVNFVWDAPSPKIGGPVGSIIGGWELAGIFTAGTGTPFTPLMSGDPVGMKGDAWPFPDRVAGCDPINSNYRNNIIGTSYLNTSCFIPPVAPPSFAAVCQPAAASVAAVIPNTCMNLNGNGGRNEISGPGLANLDFSVIKNTRVRKLSESFNVQFRAEMFNILNRANFQSPLDNTNVLTATGTAVSGAGFIDATATPSREIQLALKIIW